MDDLQTFHGPNAGYVLELYERYLKDPASVDAVTRAAFERWSPVQAAPVETPAVDVKGAVPYPVAHVVAASALAHAIRERGHLGAHLDPLGSEPLGDPALLPETHGITEADLANCRQILSVVIPPKGSAALWKQSLSCVPCIRGRLAMSSTR